jgi:exosortase A
VHIGPAVGAGLAVAGVAFGLWSGWRLLHYHWTTTFTYSHGYLVAAIAAWLLFRAVRAHGAGRVRPWWPGLAGLAAVAVAYVLADLLGVNLLRLVLLPPALWMLVLTLAGLTASRRAFWPLAFLYFAIPVWDVLIDPLQDVTTLVVSNALALIGVPAFIEGHLVHLPAGVFEIAEGCSGLHFFVVALALAACFGLAYLSRPASRLKVLAAFGLMALMANWLRVLTLIVVGHVTEMQHSLMHDHYLFGWLVFVVLMLPATWLALYLERREPPASAPETVMVGALAAVVLAAPGALRGVAPAAAPDVPERLALAAPAGWTETAPTEDWGADFQRASQVLLAAFQRDGGGLVEAYVARYPTQSGSAKLIHFRNRIHAEHWQWDGSVIRSTMLTTTPRRVLETVLTARQERRVVRHWYRVGGRVAHTGLHARLLEIPALLFGRRDAAVLAVSAACGVTCDQAEADLSEFLRVAGAELEALADGRPSDRATMANEV